MVPLSLLFLRTAKVHSMELEIHSTNLQGWAVCAVKAQIPTPDRYCCLWFLLSWGGRFVFDVIQACRRVQLCCRSVWGTIGPLDVLELHGSHWLCSTHCWCGMALQQLWSENTLSQAMHLLLLILCCLGFFCLICFILLPRKKKKSYPEGIVTKLLKFSETFLFLFTECFSVLCHTYLKSSHVDRNGVHNTN